MYNKITGTVTMVSTMNAQNWHRSKGLETSLYKLHEGLEDGTLPFHSILALGESIDVHQRLYHSMEAISLHTSSLVHRLFQGLSQLRHGNEARVCRIYCEKAAVLGGSARQGPVLAFNVVQADGQFLPYSDVETLANNAGIYIRSGGAFSLRCLLVQTFGWLNRFTTGVCNPGGIFSALGYEPWMMERALSAGHHCGSHGIDVIHTLPTGLVFTFPSSQKVFDMLFLFFHSIVRVSVGAMSTRQDVDTFLGFMRDTFVQTQEESWVDSPRSTICSAQGEGIGIGISPDMPSDYVHKFFPDVREIPRPRPIFFTATVPV
jgi:molybdenum cofactor sulfurtransferase